MSIKKNQLKKNYDDYVAAEEFFTQKLSSLTPDNNNPGRNKQLFDEILPIVRAAVEKKLKDSQWDQREIQQLIGEKIFLVLFGPDFNSHLNKL